MCPWGNMEVLLARPKPVFNIVDCCLFVSSSNLCSDRGFVGDLKSETSYNDLLKSNTSAERDGTRLPLCYGNNTQGSVEVVRIGGVFAQRAHSTGTARTQRQLLR